MTKDLEGAMKKMKKKGGEMKKKGGKGGKGGKKDKKVLVSEKEEAMKDYSGATLPWGGEVLGQVWYVAWHQPDR